MGCNQPNLRVSGAEGTGRYQGTGSSHERRYARRFTAGRGGERARQSPGRGQFWLPRVVRRHTSERISTQKWRAVFSGRSGPRLIVQVVRFRFYFGASVLSCVLLAACTAMRNLALYAHFPGETLRGAAGWVGGRVGHPPSTPAQAWLASVPAAVPWQQ